MTKELQNKPVIAQYLDKYKDQEEVWETIQAAIEDLEQCV